MTHWPGPISYAAARLSTAPWFPAFGDPAAELAAARDAAVVCDLAPLAALACRRSRRGEPFCRASSPTTWRRSRPARRSIRRGARPRGACWRTSSLRRVDADALRAAAARAAARADSQATRHVRAALEGHDRRRERGKRCASASAGPAARQAVESLGVGAPPLHRSAAIAEGRCFSAAGQALRRHRRAGAARRHAGIDWPTRARPAGFPCWQWLTIRAGVPVILPADAGSVHSADDQPGRA